MDKVGLREVLREQRRSLSATEITKRSNDVALRVRSLPEFASAQVVAFYAASEGEVDLSDLAANQAAAGQTVCYPRVRSRALVFHSVSAASDLKTDAFGIAAPAATAPEVSNERIDVFLVPGVAFDARGARLGRGGGYYDAALRNARGTKIGIGWDFQIVPEVPVEAHDVPMNMVVTESRTLRGAL